MKGRIPSKNLEFEYAFCGSVKKNERKQAELIAQIA